MTFGRLNKFGSKTNNLVISLEREDERRARQGGALCTLPTMAPQQHYNNNHKFLHKQARKMNLAVGYC